MSTTLREGELRVHHGAHALDSHVKRLEPTSFSEVLFDSISITSSGTGVG